MLEDAPMLRFPEETVEETHWNSPAKECPSMVSRLKIFSVSFFSGSCLALIPAAQAITDAKGLRRTSSAIAL